MFIFEIEEHDHIMKVPEVVVKEAPKAAPKVEKKVEKKKKRGK